MRETSQIVVILLALMVVACAPTEEDDGDDNTNQAAPYFDTLGNQNVITGGTLNFTVVATDPNGMNITLAADGTVGPNANPFAAGANFNAGNGDFTWNTDASDGGNYSVRFTATNGAFPPLSSDVTITIQVSDPEAPTINPISTQNVTTGGTVNFFVVANDPNGFNITLSADGTLGPNNNPFTAGATFTAGTGNFVWNTDAMDVGSYSVRFTATNDASPPLDASINVTINVNDPVIANGEDLYNQFCQSCHGTNGIGGSQSIVQCSIEISIREAVGLEAGVTPVGSMTGIPGRMSDPDNDIRAIANFLTSFPGC